MSKATVINLKVPQELKEQVQKKAQAEGESVSTIIRQLLKDWAKA